MKKRKYPKQSVGLLVFLLPVAFLFMIKMLGKISISAPNSHPCSNRGIKITLTITSNSGIANAELRIRIQELLRHENIYKTCTKKLYFMQNENS